MWAALFHNIGKRTYPEIVGEDHISAFMSAATTLKIFEKMKLIKLNTGADEQ